MKILVYSDLHLEFGTKIKPPLNSDADLMVLAGDIITFKDFTPLDDFLSDWKKPVIYVAGNHEYYTRQPMYDNTKAFQQWLEENHSNVTFLDNKEITINGINFFGGTMWTDFNNGNNQDMLVARHQMNDYRHVRINKNESFRPEDTILFHNNFLAELKMWFNIPISGSRVVITHHAPIINPKTKYLNSSLSPAFNATDTLDLILEYQPDLWIYGHTHECDDHKIGKTRIVSNQLGYPMRSGGYECEGFDKEGMFLFVE